MKVRFVELPHWNTKPSIEAHLGEVGEVVNMKKWEGEKSPAMWLVQFSDTTIAWLKPRFLEIVNEPLDIKPKP